MQSKWLGRIGLSVLVMGATCGSALMGCAEERDPINRVQAGVLDKTFFLGNDLADFRDDPEFRTKTFNIDSAANTDNYSGTIGGASAVERVRWEVTEQMLFARRSYQESPGADNRGLRRVEVEPGKWEWPTAATGTIIAAYRIQSHFDVRRDYNPSTGEETNTVVENTSDRPWNQRQYMRVDWSENLAESTSGDINWIFGENTSASAVAYSPNNDNDPDRPTFEVEKGYFDITNKYLLKSESTGIWGLSECLIMGFFNGTTSFDCTPTEVKVRSSFERMPVEVDFEPFQESNAFLDIIGNWGNAGSNYMREYGAPPVTAWDPQYGFNDAKTTTFYSLHNIWEKSHQDVRCTSNADEKSWADGKETEGADGTADQCSNAITGYTGHEGSQCDLYVGKEYKKDGKCTIPVRDRKVKTIAYWLNAEAPQDLTDQVAEDGTTITEPGALEENTVTWNQLMRVAIATRREVECRRTLKDHTVSKTTARDECHFDYFEVSEKKDNSEKEMVAFGGWGIDKVVPQAVDEGAPAFVTCHNPVRAYDLPLCGKVGEVIRLGDLRKNYAIYWPYASRAPYGGVATIGADPLTGEMMGSTATIMMRSATAAAAQQRDIIALALGDITVDDIIGGEQAVNYSKYVSAGRLVGNQDNGLTKAATVADLSNAVKALDTQNLKVAGGALSAKFAAMTPMQRSIEVAKLKATLSPNTASIAADNVRVGALTDKLSSTEFAADIANRGLLKILAASQADASPTYQAIAALAKTNPEQLNNLIDQFSFYLGNKGICFQETMANAGAGSLYQPQLAPYFKKLYGGLSKEERGLAIYRDLLREAVKGIAFHEIGHSIGMRHNFASSWDARNYTPQYWQLRTNEGKSTATCTGPREGDNDTCMGPRYLDPETAEEQGLGTESRPGIEYFANTSTMEYQIERFGETVGAGLYDLHMMKTLYGRSLEVFDTRITKDGSRFTPNALSQGIPDDISFQSSGLQASLGMHYTKFAVQAKLFDPSRDCRAATDEEKAAAKWRIVHGKICSPQTKNHMAYEDMKSSPLTIGISSPTPIGADGVRWQGVDEKGEAVFRWLYRYGEDYSSGGYMHAKMFDSGADVYEITKNVARRFNAVYPWQYFRRGNKEFAWWSIAGSVSNATFARLRGYHWNTATDLSRADAPDLEDDDQARPSVMAGNEMFNFFQNVLLMPEPGRYGDGSNTELRAFTKAGGLKVWDVMEDYEIRDSNQGFSSLQLVDGRFVQVDFDNFKGGSWDYQNFPKHWGFDEEKVRALKELVDSRPTLSTVSRENALDGRDPYISFRTDLPHALDRLLGGMLSEDWETIAPSLGEVADPTTDKGQVVPFNLLAKDLSTQARPAGSRLIFPNMGYQNELGSAIYAYLFSRAATDMTLANKLRVRIEGDAGPAIPTARKEAFTDPNSGFRYFATRFGTENIQGRAVELGIASRMLQHANDLLAAIYEVEVDTVTNKEIWNANGEPQLKLGTDGQPIARAGDTAALQSQLRRYVGFLDGLRQVGNILGGGTLGGGGGGHGDE